MTIEYALTRIEIVQGYFRSLRCSPRYRATVLLYCVGFGLTAFLLRMSSSRPVTVGDVLIAIAWAIGLFAFIPLWLFIRGKTSTRTFTISPEGIYTKIGKIQAQIPWRKVKLVKGTDHHVLIARLGGDALRAFSGPTDREQFLAAIDGWMKARRGTTTAAK